MMLKPQTYYWYWCRPADPSFVEGVTELHEGTAPSINYCSHVRTDENGEIVRFQQMGEVIFT